MLDVGGSIELNDWSGLRVGRWDQKGKWHAGNSGSSHVEWDSERVSSANHADEIAGTPVEGYRGRLDGFDAAMSAAAFTGTAVLTASNAITLTGDGQSSLQKFELPYGTFAEAFQADSALLNIENVPTGASIVLNVSGGSVQIPGDVDFVVNGKAIVAPQPPYVTWADQDLGDWGALTQRVLWRFPEASEVKIGSDRNGHTQLVGSILAAQQGTHLEIHESTNGRVLSFGDLTFHEGDRENDDWAEFHAFPFLFPGGGCSETQDGTFALRKVVEGIEDDLPEGTTFEVRANWEEIDAGTGNLVPRSELLALGLDGDWVHHGDDQEATLPAGTIVTFQEVGVVLPEGTQLPEGVALDSAEFLPGFVVIGAAASGASEVTLTNTYKKAATGTFTLNKALEGVSAGQFPTGTVFEVDATWVANGETNSQRFELPADGTAVSGPELPVGTVVEFAEADPRTWMATFLATQSFRGTR